MRLIDPETIIRGWFETLSFILSDEMKLSSDLLSASESCSSMLHCIFVRIYQRLMDNEIATYSIPISGAGEIIAD
jgi:hypothetical protein